MHGRGRPRLHCCYKPKTVQRSLLDPSLCEGSLPQDDGWDYGAAVPRELLHFPFEVVFDLVEEVIAIIRAADAVGLVGIDHEAELFACLD
jgi:hypothetical protein